MSVIVHRQASSPQCLDIKDGACCTGLIPLISVDSTLAMILTAPSKGISCGVSFESAKRYVVTPFADLVTRSVSESNPLAECHGLARGYLHEDGFFEVEIRN